MMPICDISVMAKPPVKNSGITSIRAAVRPQIAQRARFIGR